jgi:cystathionine beta-lyase/cystathionine gamma-synthase
MGRWRFRFPTLREQGGPIMVAQSFSTRAIHGGLAPDPTTGAILTPIYQSTTFVQEAVGKHKGYTYSRSGNPTVAALERNLGALENALPAACFGTGMAALTALCLGLLAAGDLVVVSDVVYGGTARLLRQVLAAFGVRASFVDTARREELEAAAAKGPRLVLIESPANPTLKLTDLAVAAEIAHAAGALLAVDNTLLSPALQQPFDLGADLVVHSTTKYIEGHNATVGGAVLTRDPELAERIRFVQNAIGAIQSPQEAWLTLRGIKTLEMRMARHSASALAVARFLAAHPRIASVTYPWLDTFPQLELARRQQRAGGGIVAFEVAGGVEAGVRLLAAVRLCALAENLGAVETLITHPASMTHAAMPPEERQAVGIGEGLIRLSVGLEDPADIIDDLDRALRA